MRGALLTVLLAGAVTGSFVLTLQLLNWSDRSPRVGDPPSERAAVVGLATTAIEVIGDNFNLSWRIDNVARLRGRKVDVRVKMKTSAAKKFGLQIYDGIGSTTSPVHTGKGEWEEMSISHQISGEARFLSIRIVQSNQLGKRDSVLFKDVVCEIDGESVKIDVAALALHRGKGNLPLGWVFDGGTAEIRSAVGN